MDARIAVINLFQVDLDKPWNYLRYCCEKAPPLPLTPFWKVGRQCPRSLASLLTTVYFATGVVKNGLYFPRFVSTRRKRCYSFTAWLRLRRSSNDIWRSQLLSLSKKKLKRRQESRSILPGKVEDKNTPQDTAPVIDKVCFWQKWTPV